MSRHLNLLPEAIRRRYVLRQVARRWSCVAALGMLAVGVLGWCAWEDVARRSGAVKQLRADLEPLKDIGTRLNLVRNQIDEADLLLELAARADEHSPSLLTLLGTVTDAVHASDGTICVSDLKFEEITDQERLEHERGDYLLTLAGFSTGATDIEAFVASLESSSRFDRVELISTQNTTRDEIQVTNYTITCSF